MLPSHPCLKKDQYEYSFPWRRENKECMWYVEQEFSIYMNVNIIFIHSKNSHAPNDILFCYCVHLSLKTPLLNIYIIYMYIYMYIYASIGVYYSYCLILIYASTILYCTHKLTAMEYKTWRPVDMRHRSACYTFVSWKLCDWLRVLALTVQVPNYLATGTTFSHFKNAGITTHTLSVWRMHLNATLKFDVESKSIFA